MGCDAKDFLISELEMQLNETRRRLATSQCLNFVLEKHSNVLEKRLESVMSINMKLCDENGRLKSRTRSVKRSQVVITEEAVTENNPVAINQFKQEIVEEVFSSSQSPNLLTEQLAERNGSQTVRSRTRLVPAGSSSRTVRNRGSPSKRLDISKFKSLSLHKKKPFPLSSRRLWPEVHSKVRYQWSSQTNAWKEPQVQVFAMWVLNQM